MKRTVLIICSLMVVVPLCMGQRRFDATQLDNKRRITDRNTSLFNLESDYGFPYEIPSVDDITEKLLRICTFLEKSTESRIFDPVTGVEITDYTQMPNGYEFAQGDFRPYTYEWGVTYIGMLHAYSATGEDPFATYVAKRMSLLAGVAPYAFDRLSKDPASKLYPRDVFVPRELDHAGAIGAAMILSILELPGGEEMGLRPLIDNSLRYITDSQHRLGDGTFARIRPYPNTLWLDDMYMSIPALSRMYQLTGNKSYLTEAFRQVDGFSQRMFNPSRKLFMHGWVDIMRYHSEYFWARANGWAVLSMAELLDVTPEDHPGRQKLLDLYREHCAGLLACQHGSGMWHQLLDHPDSYLESSASAIFTYCFARGINSGWLDPLAFGPATLLAWNAVADQVNNEGQIENVCVGTSVAFDPAYYYNRHVHVYTAHGYGPVLMAGSEIMQMLRSHGFVKPSPIYMSSGK